MRLIKNLLRNNRVPADIHKVVSPSSEEIDVAEIRASSLFDTEFYLSRNPDVAASGVDPIVHYMATGASEGRDPGPGFDWRWYLGECPEAGAVGMNPLLHYLRFGQKAGMSPKAIDDGQAFDSFSAASRAGALPFAASYRTAIEQVDFPIEAPATLAPDGMPSPPVSLTARIGSPDLDHMASIGRGVRDTILRCLPPGFDFAGKRCLDYGCGIGRVIRYFSDDARTCEFWGCDIDGPSVRWLTEQLSPPFRFYRISPAPSLPFEDDSFDLIYAIGVFSQIYDDWHQLAVELRRILRPGGTLIMSYPGQNSFEDQIKKPISSNPGMVLINPFNPWSLGGPLVFLSTEWIKRYWGAIFDIDFIAPNGLLDYDTLVVMRKPERGAPLHGTGRIVEVGTQQKFHPDAFGMLKQSYDQTKLYLNSYGIEVAPGLAEVGGFIAMRASPDRIEVSVDDLPIPSTVEWSPSRPYERRPGLVMRDFAVRFDTPDIASKRSRLDVKVYSACGVDHTLSISFLIIPSLSEKS